MVYYMAMCYSPNMDGKNFEWDKEKNQANKTKHGVSFYEAQKAFLDVRRVIARDTDHSASEERYYCFGQVDSAVMTVRFTYRNNKIRIFGAGYWRKGRKIYEKENN